MRLKYSLGILLLLSVFVTGAAAGTGATQLSDIGVKSQGNATTLTIHATGAFTHTEYRPTDNLLLVDMAGVSAAKLENQSRDLKGQFPGVESYRVVGYKAASGTSIARIEINLAANAVVAVSDTAKTVSVRVKSDSPVTASAPTAPAASPAMARPVAAAKGVPVQIRNVSVSRGKNGLHVAIAASGAIAPTALRLSSPDRIVVDVPNAVPAMRQREIAVNHDEVKSIRVARYSLKPPSTRIVVDLNSKHEFELSQKGSRATLMLQGKQAELPLLASTTPMVPQAVAPAPNAVVVEPTYTSRPATDQEIAEVRKSPSERAAEAASKFSSPSHDIPASNANASVKMQPALNLAMMQQQSMAAQPAATTGARTGCTTGRYNGEPISVNLKDVDLRDFFRLIHDISGLNVVLDPLVRGSLTIVLDDVPWDQALAIVLNNNGLECQLDGNVLRIATTATLKKEADDRRAQQDAQALAVEMITINRYLSYAVAKDVAPTMKSFLSPRGTVISDDRTNSLIISDIPNVMANIDRQIKELDRKTQEVEIEARVVSASRNFARDLGVQIGFGWNNSSTGVFGAGGATSPIVSSLPFNGGSIPLFSNLGVGGATTSGIALSTAGSNYRLDAILTMAESRGLAKILSRPRVVTQNNIQAIVKQGQRIPVVTGAQLGGPPTVTYVEAVLRLTVKPQITAENTIFLNVDVENTTPDFSRTTSNQPNPALTTQQATTSVLVSDGGTVMIGGVIQTTSSVNITQVPVLGNIPIFGNLFKRRGVTTSSNELIFFLTPKIIQT
ncbi:MAG TPA: type IV pilus secretin PilQ [Terriglobales bacterium]|nr:type IV pilus secretin PilQ [Terriglobales bacterium]